MKESSTSENDAQLSVWKNSGGYNYVSHKGEMISIHQLSVITAGADPHDVFAPETEVHHELHANEPIDIPENLTVLTKGEHRRHHRGQSDPVRAESIIDPNTPGDENTEDQ
jgi:hypothetical protein